MPFHGLGLELPYAALLGGAGNTLVPAGAAAAAALARLPATPSTATRNKMVTAINALAAGGWWSKMDFFHFYGADNTPNAAVDLTGNGHTAVPTNNPTFLPKYGYQFNSAFSSYINTQFTPSTQGVNYTLNSMSLGVMVANNRTTADTSVVIGDINGSTTFDQIAPLFTGNVAIGILASSGSSMSVASTSARGLWIDSKTGATTQALYLNGTSIGTSSNAADALTTHPMIVGARYVSGGGAGTIGNYSNDTVTLAFAGSGFSAGDIAGINSALQGLMPASGTMPTVAAAWGFTNTTLNYVPTDLSGVDTGLTNGPGFTWYPQSFWGVGNPNGSDFTYSGGALIANASVNANYYRARLSSRGNTTSTFSGSISGTTLVVNTMLGVTAAQGGTGYTNPVAVGQRVAGANMGVTQPSNGPKILSQLSGTPGGVGTYQLDTSFGTITSQVFNGYSDVGAIPAFKAGGWFEYQFSFDPSLSAPLNGDTTVPAHPTFEMVSINSLWGHQFENVTHSTRMHGGEIDLLEVYPGATLGNPRWLLSVVDETAASDYIDWTLIVANPNELTFAQMGSPTFTNPNIFSVLWVPAFMNGGVGLIYRYINGVHITAMDITYGTTGPLSILDSDRMVLQIDGGLNQPTKVYYVKVLQTP